MLDYLLCNSLNGLPALHCTGDLGLPGGSATIANMPGAKAGAVQACVSYYHNHPMPQILPSGGLSGHAGQHTTSSQGFSVRRRGAGWTRPVKSGAQSELPEGSKLGIGGQASLDNRSSHPPNTTPDS